MSSSKSRTHPKQSAEVVAKAAMYGALDRRELFKAGQLALGLSRVPGRMETDEAEAYRILQHLMAWYARGQFAPSEVVVCHDKLGIQPFREIEKQITQLSGFEWREAVMLTRAACKRYLEQSTLEGAPRQLKEWFPTCNNLQGGPIHDAIPDSVSSSGESGDSSKPRPTDVWPDRGKPDVSTQIGVVHAASAEKPTIPEAMLKAYFQTERDNGHIPAADPSKLALEQQYPHYKVPRKLVRTAHQQVFPGTPAGKRQSRR